LNVERAQIQRNTKFQLHEGPEKQALLERYLNSDAEHKQAFINPYTGENMESKLAGSMRDNHTPMNKEKFSGLVFETDSSYDSQEDITNLSELIKLKKLEKTNVISETQE